MLKLTPLQIRDLKKDFNNFDTNKNGTIEKDELFGLLNGLGIETSVDKLDELMNEIDKNKDGEINFLEFIDWHNTNKEDEGFKSQDYIKTQSLVSLKSVSSRGANKDISLRP